MTTRNAPKFFLLLLIATATMQQAAQAQTGASGSDATVKIDSAAPNGVQGSVPRFIRFSGTMHASNGEALHGVAGLEFALYKEREGGSSLWMETQNVEMDEQGRYTVLIGATKNEGISPDLLGSGESRWLGVRVVGEPEQPRLLLVSVPYALRAEDATKLGGSSADEFVRKQDLQQAVHETLRAATSGGGSNAPGSVHAQDAAAINAASIGPTTFTGSTTTNIVAVQQTGTGTALVASAPTGGAIAGVGGGYGVYGKATSATGIGVEGIASATGTATGVGVSGISSSGAGIGVSGNGGAIGVSGVSRSIKSSGVKGESTDITDTTGNDFGVLGVGHNSGGAGVSGTNTAITGNAFGVIGTTASTSGVGVQGNANGATAIAVFGFNNATTGAAIGVQGGTNSPNGNGVVGNANAPNGNGVYGFNSATSGFAPGVSGGTNSSAGPGVNGFNSATTGFAVGVNGNSNSPAGAAVSGFNNATTGAAIGVQGGTNSPSGAGVVGNANAPNGNGVLGFNSATSGFAPGVSGATNSSGGAGVNGFNNATTGLAVGVQGGTNSPSGNGVIGNANAPSGNGVFGFNSATSGFAPGVNGATNSPAGPAVNGFNNALTGLGVGVLGGSASPGGIGVEGAVNSPNGNAVSGINNATSGSGAAVVGTAFSPNAAGVAGFNNATTGGTGVYGSSVSSAGMGVFGVNSAGGLAGRFDGNVQVNGNLNASGTVSKSGGSFRIDHPLEPATKYLYHSFVESPDMKNIYDGVATLDAAGEAVITLPDWFEALNQDFRYQLTCLGAFAPMYVADEIQANHFRIAGGRTGMKISWQVTGIRKDAYAKAHRIPVEEQKQGAERGRYLDPTLFGQPEDLRIGGAMPSVVAQK